MSELSDLFRVMDKLWKSSVDSTAMWSSLWPKVRLSCYVYKAV